MVWGAACKSVDGPYSCRSVQSEYATVAADNSGTLLDDWQGHIGRMNRSRRFKRTRWIMARSFVVRRMVCSEMEVSNYMSNTRATLLIFVILVGCHGERFRCHGNFLVGKVFRQVLGIRSLSY